MKLIEDAIYGFIVGDVYGLSILDNDLNTMKLKRNKTLNIDKGCFSSLTTFLLASIDSINKNNDIIIDDILSRMCMSLILGKYTNNGKVYDLDNNTLKILEFYSKKNTLEGYKVGSSSAYFISKIIPISLYSYAKDNDFSNFLKIASIFSLNNEDILGLYIYNSYLINILNGLDKVKALKIDIPEYLKDNKYYYKDILKGKFKKNKLIFDDSIYNTLYVVFYTIFNSKSFEDILILGASYPYKKNLYLSLSTIIGGIIYGKDSIPSYLLKDIKNKKDINKYIKEIEKNVL